MTEPKHIEGKKPDHEIPPDKIGRLSIVTAEEAAGRASAFWVKCWNCHQFLTRPLSPPSQQAYTCANCGAVNTV